MECKSSGITSMYRNEQQQQQLHQPGAAEMTKTLTQTWK